jgi:A/G-specific adenine glycosylase
MQDALLAWGTAHRRDLPWRHTRDPWPVLVSELMLQQTQVVRVVPRYGLFLRRLPTAAACAAAPAGEVLRLWAGLGYNRRALHLHRAAAAVVERHGGSPPASLADLLALPGIGPYTARAVLAFAYDRDVAVLDVNAGRLLARAFGTGTQQEADALVPRGRAWEWNTAVLDLGATVCTSRSPRCGDCPLVEGCAWRRRCLAPPDPARRGPRQAPFPGSDRQGRGRLVEALRGSALPADGAAAAMGWPDDDARARRVVAGLVAEGMVALDEGVLRLP